jgi:hypothetical protein
MKIAYYLSSGIKQGLSRFKLAVYLWLIILGFSVVAIAPVSSIIKNNLGNFYPGRPPLLPFELHLVEVFMANQNIFQPYFSLVLTIILVFGLLTVFLNAGVFGRMTDREKKINFRDFLNDGCRYFWQFFLTVLISLPFFVLLLGLYRLLGTPVKAWTAEATTEWPFVIGSNLRMIIFILLWTIFKMLFDLVRIIIVSESKKLLPSLGSALRFLKNHFFKLWWLDLIIGFGFVIVSAIFLMAGRFLSTSHLAGVLVIIILSQAYLLFRLFTRLVFIGVETSYYSENRGAQ